MYYTGKTVNVRRYKYGTIAKTGRSYYQTTIATVKRETITRRCQRQLANRQLQQTTVRHYGQRISLTVTVKIKFTIRDNRETTTAVVV